MLVDKGEGEYYLEHDGQDIGLTTQEYESLLRADVVRRKFFLKQQVIPRLSENPKSILTKWLSDPEIDTLLKFENFDEDDSRKRS